MLPSFSHLPARSPATESRIFPETSAPFPSRRVAELHSARPSRASRFWRRRFSTLMALMDPSNLSERRLMRAWRWRNTFLSSLVTINLLSLPLPYSSQSILYAASRFLLEVLQGAFAEERNVAAADLQLSCRAAQRLSGPCLPVRTSPSRKGKKPGEWPVYLSLRDLCHTDNGILPALSDDTTRLFSRDPASTLLADLIATNAGLKQALLALPFGIKGFAYVVSVKPAPADFHGGRNPWPD